MVCLYYIPYNHGWVSWLESFAISCYRRELKALLGPVTGVRPACHGAPTTAIPPQLHNQHQSLHTTPCRWEIRYKVDTKVAQPHRMLAEYSSEQLPQHLQQHKHGELIDMQCWVSWLEIFTISCYKRELNPLRGPVSWVRWVDRYAVLDHPNPAAEVISTHLKGW